MATILIVDDLPANRAFLVTLLDHQGHRLIEASNGAQGLALALQELPDLVVTDVLMPVMDGFELVRHLRLDPITCRIPVLFYTAPYGEREAREVARSTGVAYVLTKPAEAAEVLEIVSRLLAGASAEGTADPSDASTEWDREYLRLLTHALAEHAEDPRIANARLRAVINIGLELASRPDAEGVLQSVCCAARDLFGATYVTLGVLDLADDSLQQLVTYGLEPGTWIQAGDPIPGVLQTVVGERRPLRGVNLNGDPEGLRLPALHPQVQAFLVAPVASPAHVHGWLCLVGNEGTPFTDEDEELVTALAAQVGRIYELKHQIRERHQAESALRREQDQSQRYLDTAQVILLALDMDGRITLINRKGCDLLGWSERELLGRDWVETCLPRRTWATSRQRLRQILNGDQPFGESPVLTRWGDERLIDWRNTVRRDDEGRVLGTFSSGTDITERMRAVEALGTAEERMRFALDATGVGIWDMDFATGVLQWSEILESQYGLQPRSFGGTFDAFLERVHPQDRDAVLAAFTEAKRCGSDFTVQHRALQPDGTARWLSGSGRIHLGANGEPARGVGISLDITDRHMLEEKYQQTQRMEAIGRLAGGVAHDFNNLLTVILGYCGLLLDGPDPDPRRRSHVQEIQKAGASAAALTRQLLAFSRKQIIEPAVLDLNEVVGDLHGMLGRLIGEDVGLQLSLSPAPALVKADRGQMEQVIVNLAVNARDAMPGGGTLTIAVDHADVDGQTPTLHRVVAPGSYVVLRVTDTGIGIPPDVQARIFEPFFTTKAIGSGTGLGLATVHAIVTQGQGTVTVHSSIGKGSSFDVYLPREDAAEGVVETRPPIVHPTAGGETVLVVEDAEPLRELARILLQQHGYTVLVAANAPHALRMFDQHASSIRVLLTDVVMPGGSGPELAAQLQARHPAVKVIYMSGYTDDIIVHHGVLDAGIAFLHKPFTAESLGRKVREVLDQ